MDDTATWALIHHERAAMADTLAALSSEQWSQPSLCGDWSVQKTAGHIVVGAEQSTGRFLKGLASSGFRFNAMVDRDAQRAGDATPDQIIERLRARVATTNRPPAPVATMLGEVVVHGIDIRKPLGLAPSTDPAATVACLELYKLASFPIGSKKRISGLRLHATDVGWTYGEGPEVSGPGDALLLAMTGRSAGLADLTGDGVASLTSRMD